MLESIGLQPHLWIVPTVGVVFILICLVFMLVSRKWGDDSYGMDGFQVTAWISLAIAIVIWIVSVLLFIPFNGKYHMLYTLEGRIDSVTNTLSEGSGGLSPTPVLKLSTYDQPITTDDLRVHALRGKDVVLTCKINWSMYGLDQTTCEVRQIK